MVHLWLPPAVQELFPLNGDRFEVKAIHRPAVHVYMPESGHSLGHKVAVIVVQNGTGNCPEESKGMNMSVQPGLGVRRRISADVACITVRQIKGKEVRLLFNYYPAGDAHIPCQAMGRFGIR